MSFYDDPVLATRRALEEQAARPSFVDAECERVSQQIIAGEWLQIPADDGIGMQCVRKVLKRPAQNVDEYVAELKTAKPHGWFEEAVVGDADGAFLGNGTVCTLKARGDFLNKYGPVVYAATLQQYGCTDTSLKAGTKPQPTVDGAGKKLAPAAGSSTNPWSDVWRGTPAERAIAQGNIIAKGIPPKADIV